MLPISKCNLSTFQEKGLTPISRRGKTSRNRIAKPTRAEKGNLTGNFAAGFAGEFSAIWSLQLGSRLLMRGWLWLPVAAS